MKMSRKHLERRTQKSAAAFFICLQQQQQQWCAFCAPSAAPRDHSSSFARTLLVREPSSSSFRSPPELRCDEKYISCSWNLLSSPPLSLYRSTHSAYICLCAAISLLVRVAEYCSLCATLLLLDASSSASVANVSCVLCLCSPHAILCVE